jgi:asparagine synthase (glutamine-hydrolysing)
MCGIAGYLSINAADTVAKQMADALIHRGPDDSGVWCEPASGIALAHRRLAIIDLSPEGHQPMVSVDSRYMMVFNGEVYNHAELRAELKETVWRGHSDTEVMLAAISEWGLNVALAKFVGMFAIALWDKQEQRLYLIRDRMGEKPLYYGWVDNAFVFGSELKALKQFPNFSNSIDRDALALYLRHCYIPAPYSIYQSIYKLQAGGMLSLTLDDVHAPPANYPAYAPFNSQSLKLQQWWSLHDVVASGQQNLITDEAQAVDLLESRLRESVCLQAQADVPLGAFLSGGVDSSLIVALMQSQATTPVNTFTIGFEDRRYNEADYALAVAKHLGTAHTELYITAHQALEVIEKLPQLYDEPFADSSQIPTYLVCSQARQHLTVALSGDGGDELFCGYNRYFWVKRIWNKISWLPFSTRKLLSNTLMVLPSRHCDYIYSIIEHLLPSKFHVVLVGDKIHKMAARLATVGDDDALFYSLISEWKQPDNIVIGANEPSTLLTRPNDWPLLANIEDRMMYLDAMSYLPDDILVKVDRAAMGVSLETRVPFLDHRVVELAWQMPLTMKYYNGLGKQPLRQILYKYVPKELIERPKQGFGMPVGDWLREPLRDWAEALLNEERLRKEGFFNPEPIRQKWLEHLSGQRNWEHSLWIILMFQLWLENNS